MDNEELDELTDTLKIKKLMQTASKTDQYCNSELAVPYMDKSLHGLNFVIAQKFLFSMDSILQLEDFRNM